MYSGVLDIHSCDVLRRFSLVFDLFCYYDLRVVWIRCDLGISRLVMSYVLESSREVLVASMW